MRKYEYVKKDKRKNGLRHGVDCFVYSVRVPVAMKKAAKKQGLSIQDFIFKAVLKELKQNESINHVNRSDCGNSDRSDSKESLDGVY